MKRYTQKEIKEIVKRHKMWLNGEKGGERANLEGADLQCADLPNGIYQVVGCGSSNRCTTYDSINDCVICGCWNDNNGNNLDSFKHRIEDVYGKDGKDPNTKYYNEYATAIAFFETVKNW